MEKFIDSSNVLVCSEQVSHDSSNEHSKTFHWVLQNIWNLPKYIRSNQFTMTVDCKLVWKIEVQLAENPRAGQQKSLLLKTNLYRIDHVERTVQANVQVLLMDKQEDIIYDGQFESAIPVETSVCPSSLSVCLQNPRLYSLPDYLSLSITMKTDGCCSNMDTDVGTSVEQVDTIQDSPTMFNDFRSALESQLLSDVIFETSNGQFRANRLILSARSPVFKKLFRNYHNNSSIVYILDHPKYSEVFKVFLFYLYTGLLRDVSVDQICILYEVAVEFDVKVLQQTCSYMLAAEMKTTNVCRILELAHKHADGCLKDVAMRFVAFNYTDLAISADWEQIMAIDSDLFFELFNNYFVQATLNP